jgi:hypothetical protein
MMTRTLAFPLALLLAGACCAAPAAWAADEMASSTAKPQISQAAAKADITNDNYTDVTNLQRTAKGWTAKAKDMGSPVSLLVTNSGDVEQQ